MFVDGGSTGSAATWWGTPGGGGRGNQPTGEIDQHAPDLAGSDGVAGVAAPGTAVPPGGRSATDGNTTSIYGADGTLVSTTVATDADGARRTTTTTYDGQGHKTSVIETTDDKQGHRTRTTTTYDGQDHKTGSTTVDEKDDGAGHTVRTTTTTDAQGHAAAPATETVAATSAKGWVVVSTWHATVTRSYTSPLVGNNGTYYITQAAVTRLVEHEQKHVANSKAHHDAIIVPLEARTRLHETEPKALWFGKVKADATGRLEAFVNWAASIKAFVDADTADNQPPNGTVDAADLATGTYPVDRGPRTVDGTDYAHFIDLP